MPLPLWGLFHILMVFISYYTKLYKKQINYVQCEGKTVTSKKRYKSPSHTVTVGGGPLLKQLRNYAFSSFFSEYLFQKTFKNPIAGNGAGL